MYNIPYIERVNDKSIRVVCVCTHSFNQPLNDFEPRFNDEFQQYENFMTEPCPKCGAVSAFNMNIPETEYDEQEMEERPFMPPEEKMFRENCRQLMWKIRPDLKKKDRGATTAAQRARVEEKRGMTIKQLEAENDRIARLTGLMD